MNTMGVLLPLLMVTWTGGVPKQPTINGRVALQAETVAASTYVEIIGPWRYHPGDRAEFADPALDDSDWALLEPTMPNGVPEDWTGIGWFRLHLAIPEPLINRPMALWFVRTGGLELFLDGERIGGMGTFEQPEGGGQPEVSFRPVPIEATFTKPEAVLAIRFEASPSLLRTLAGDGSGCAVSVSLATKVQDRNREAMWIVRFYRFFIGVSFALGLMHFLLFVFLPERKENLMYALATWAICGLSVFIETRTQPVSVSYFIAAFLGFKLCLIAVAVFGVKFYHAVLGDPPRPLFKVYVIVGVALTAVAYWLPVMVLYLYAVYGVFEQVRLAVVANMRGLRDAWILGLGVTLSGLGALFQMVPPLAGVPMPVPHAYLYGFLGMLVMMSAYQARGFARTYLDLQHRLDDVRRLSEERVEQARKVKSEEMARVRLEEENKRQAVELKEAARRQQMLAQLEAAHQELKETQAQLVQSEKMASLGQLVAGIAHEINTPVGAISSIHDSLSRATVKLKEALAESGPALLDENPRLRAAIRVIEDANDVIESGSGRVAKIVQRLKSFARLDEAELLRADVHEGLDDTLLLLHHELKRGIKVVRDYGDVPPFPCYPSQLNQVFLNLLVNARQAIQGPGEIHVSTAVVNGMAHIVFRDTGKGIPKANLPKIFDPGFTTKGVKVGTGLGLSICYRIIKEHRGQILVDSEEGQGATFTVVLPLDLDQRLEREREGTAGDA